MSTIIASRRSLRFPLYSRRRRRRSARELTRSDDRRRVIADISCRYLVVVLYIYRPRSTAIFVGVVSSLEFQNENTNCMYADRFEKRKGISIVDRFASVYMMCARLHVSTKFVSLLYTIRIAYNTSQKSIHIDNNYEVCIHTYMDKYSRHIQ